MVVFELEPEFILEEGIPMAVEDLRCGYERGMIDSNAVIALAADEVRRGATDPVLHDLASLLRDEVERVPEVLAELDDPERIYDPRGSVRKWLYLQLKAAYRDRNRLRDPLSVVERLYAEFEYPQSVATFVRYMPLSPGDEAGEHAMMERWSAFLKREQESLAIHYVSPTPIQDQPDA